MELAGNDKFLEALELSENPYIKIKVYNDDQADSPLHKTSERIELLLNALLVDFFVGKKGRPDVFLSSLDDQVNTLLEFRNAFFREIYKEDTDDGITPIPDVFKNAFD